MILAEMDTDKARLVESKYEGSAAKQILAALLACSGAFSFGYTIGFSSPAIPNMIKDNVITQQQADYFGSLMTVGAILGGPAAGWLVERIGRKRTILLSSLPFLAGWLAIGFGHAFSHFCAGRLLTGLGSGMVTVCLPVYIAEIATKSHRGVLGTCTQLFITIGIFIVYVFGSFLSWKHLSLAGLVPAVITVIGSFILPESPLWLLSKNRKADAIIALKGLRDAHMDVGEECRDIEDSIDTKESVPLSEFGKPEIYKPLLIIILIMVFQQFSGINAVLFYTVTIFEKSMPNKANIATIGVGAVQVLGTFLASFIMDKAGRRRLLNVSGFFMSSSLFLLSYVWLTDPSKTAPQGFMTWVPVIAVMVYIVGFSIGWGPIPMLVMSEILPSRVKGAASAIAILTNWTCAFLVTSEFSYLQYLFGERYLFSVFGGSCVISILFVLKYLPETKGKSLEDIELFFLGKGVSKNPPLI